MDGITNELLGEEGAFRVICKLDLFQLTLISDAEEHESAIVFDALEAEFSFIKMDASQALDGVYP